MVWIKIAYINKGKAKKRSSIDEMLELAYLRDMRCVWNKYKSELTDLGLTEVSFCQLQGKAQRKKRPLLSID